MLQRCQPSAAHPQVDLRIVPACRAGNPAGRRDGHRTVQGNGLSRCPRLRYAAIVRVIAYRRTFDDCQQVDRPRRHRPADTSGNGYGLPLSIRGALHGRAAALSQAPRPFLAACTSPHPMRCQLLHARVVRRSGITPRDMSRFTGQSSLSPFFSNSVFRASVCRQGFPSIRIRLRRQ